MNYREMNLINNALIIPPNEYRHCRYCPREEIAHPQKLETIINNLPAHWEIFNHDNEMFYMTWLPWFKTYTSYGENIFTSLFHVLTERPAMFTLFRNIVNNPRYRGPDAEPKVITSVDFMRDLNIWLTQWWNCPFLITIPILHHSSGVFITDNYYPPRRMYLENSPPHEYLDLQLTHHSYTVCNGLTLFLAYHRLGIIPASIAYPILNSFITVNRPHIFQDVTDVWYNLYYNTPIPHIADFPAFYIIAGPHFAHENILRLFSLETDYQFAEIVLPTTIVYTSPFITMFPYFNPQHWEYYKAQESWLNTANLDTDMGDIIYPDIAGFIHGMLTTKRSWKYWQCHYEEILFDMSECYISIEKLIEDLLQTCSYYYKYGSPYHNKSLKRKIRVMWINILHTLDINQTYIPLILNRYILKYQMCERLINIGRTGALWMNEMPYNLLKDIFDTYKNRLNIFNELNYVILTEHINVLRIIYPDIQMNLLPLNQVAQDDNQQYANQNQPHLHAIAPIHPIMPADPIANNINIIANNIIDVLLGTPRYVISRTPMRIFKDSLQRSILNTFYDNYIQKRILSRLCAIYKGFGLFQNQHDVTLYNDYTVGYIIINYLKLHKDDLIH
jgi:hypothetical protein